MRHSYRNWTTTARPVSAVDYTGDGERFWLGYSEVVVDVHDPHWTAEVVLENPAPRVRRPHIRSLTIRAPNVTRELLRTVPISYLAEVAAQAVSEINDDYDDERGYPLTNALEAATREPGQVEIAGQAPSLEQYADAWRDTPTAQPIDGKRVTRRQALARRYDVSPKTVDDWTRKARDQGLIPPATTGRPRTSLEGANREDH